MSEVLTWLVAGPLFARHWPLFGGGQLFRWLSRPAGAREIVGDLAAEEVELGIGEQANDSPSARTDCLMLEGKTDIESERIDVGHRGLRLLMSPDAEDSSPRRRGGQVREQDCSVNNGATVFDELAGRI